MSSYNPNSVWESREKKYEYAGPNDAVPKPPKEPSTPAEKPPTKAPEPSGGRGPSFFKRHGLWFFSVGLVAFFAFAGFVVYLLLPASSPNVAISLTKPDQVKVGQPFILSISFSNYSNSILKSAALTVMLPSGISFIGQSPNQRVIEQTVGDIGPQDIKKQDFNLLVTANPESIQHIDAKLTYATDAAAKTQFETDGGADVVVGESAVSVVFDTPANIFSGQDFTIGVDYSNNTNVPVKNLSFQMQYPPAFTFKKSSLPPSGNSNSIWNVGTLAGAATGTFMITGNIIGPEQALYPLTGAMTADFGGATYPINTQATNFVIASAPLSLSLALNNAQNYIAGLSDTLNYTLIYKNNSTVTFRSAVVKATLVGTMFNLPTIHSDGSFDSRSNTITWNAASAPGLLSITPGQSGSVTFNVETKSAFPIRLVSDKNYLLKVSAQIQSPTVPPDTAGSNTVSAANIQNKVGGQIFFTAKGYLHDAPSGMLNSGPYPPKVNQETRYTIHWRVATYSTDAQNITVSTYLQSGTTFTGNAKSNVSSTPTYDPGTGLVTWTVPIVPATTGVISPPAEAIFQVANTPGSNQINNSVTLVGPVTFAATDGFTGAAANQTAIAITTDLPDDPAIVGTNRKVIP